MDASASPSTPKAVLGFYDTRFWESVTARSTELQRCDRCGTFRYPPGPACPECLAAEATWVPISGKGTIISWVVFHRQYFPAYPPPHNVIAVRLVEGPLMIANLEGRQPEGSWIGQPVSLVYATMPDDFVLPRFVLTASASLRP